MIAATVVIVVVVVESVVIALVTFVVMVSFVVVNVVILIVSRAVIFRNLWFDDYRILIKYNFSTRSNLWSWKLRTGDLVVQLQYAEYLGRWKMRTGDFVVHDFSTRSIWRAGS